MHPEKRSRLYRFQERMRIARQGGVKMDIPFLLGEAPNLRAPEDRVKWLEQLLVWVRLSGGKATSRQTSLRFLLSRLEQNAEWKESSAAVVRALMLESSFVRLFSETGVHSNFDFVREGVSRIVRRFFPAHGDPRNMETVLDRVFSQEEDAGWVEGLPQELRQQLAAWLFSDDAFRASLREHLIADAGEATYFLCIRASAIAIQRELMDRAGASRATEIPNLRLRAAARAFFASLLGGKSREETYAAYQGVLAELEGARRYLENVHQHLEQYGVSVSLVFSLECAASIHERVETLLRLALWLRFPDAGYDPWALFARLLRDGDSEKRVGPLIRSNFHLLSRKIVEKSGATGERFITGTRAEYLSMFYAALGGGFVTAFTALAKFLGPSASAPFLVGLYSALNFSLSFVLMHQLHFKLATKQPSMTAAALASRLRGGSLGQGAEGFVDLVARISRSQFAAVAGNILAVIPTAVLIDQLSTMWLGRHVLDSMYGLRSLDTLHPFATLTVAYAALTGVALWASGTIAGWVENAFVYYQGPKALLGHPFLNLLLGERLLGRLVAAVERNLTGWASSVALGCLLAFIPVAGFFFGLPLDVRHVTLSTGAMTYGVSAIGWANVPLSTLGFTIAGILLIGAMNFGVSFALAFHVAVRANNVPRRRVAVILRACLAEAVRRPAKFLVP